MKRLPVPCYMEVSLHNLEQLCWLLGPTLHYLKMKRLDKQELCEAVYVTALRAIQMRMVSPRFEQYPIFITIQGEGDPYLRSFPVQQSDSVEVKNVHCICFLTYTISQSI